MATKKKKLKSVVEKDFSLINAWIVMFGILIVVLPVVCFGADVLEKIAGIAENGTADEILFTACGVTLVIYLSILLVHYVVVLIKKVKSKKI